MRGNLAAALVTSAALLTGLTACGEPSPEAKKVQSKMGETWDAMKAWGVERKADLLESASRGLADLKQAYAGAKAAGSEAGAAASQQLDEEWQGVQQKLDALKTASGQEWIKARDAFLQAYGVLKAKLAARPSGR